MDERLARVGQNEALFRRVNERLEDLNDAFGTVTETFDLICECGDAACVAQIAIPRSAYEQVRSDATLFIVEPDHVNASVEAAIEKHSAYHVVRKYEGLPQRIAEQTDPRR